mmetsp:Transcript_37257/g.111293  ORF Transcript_37257/g.111293 Transcript_37257/m.111293 type:complete len:178 (-) Transcript_37257:132-665(-)
MRARGQLACALQTKDESAQFRRLEQALQSPVRFDKGCKYDLQRATGAFRRLSRRLGAPEDSRLDGRAGREATPGRAPGSNNPKRPQEETARADVEGGARVESGQVDEAVLDPRPEGESGGHAQRGDGSRLREATEDAAALRIQSAFRGISVRSRVKEANVHSDADALVELVEEGGGD